MTLFYFWLVGFVLTLAYMTAAFMTQRVQYAALSGKPQNCPLGRWVAILLFFCVVLAAIWPHTIYRWMTDD